MEQRNEVVLFKADDQAFPLEIIDENGEKWVTSQQLAKALGIKNIHALHKSLAEAGEIKDGRHCSRVTLEQVSKNGIAQERTIIAYSYRGIIRLAMRAQSKRAVFFRDWAEDVLYEAMIYGTHGASKGGEDRKLIAKVEQLIGTVEAYFEQAKPMGHAIKLSEIKNRAIKKEHGSKLQWVLDIISRRPDGITLAELYEATGCKNESQKGIVRATAHKLFKKGAVDKPGVGVYKSA